MLKGGIFFNMNDKVCVSIKKAWNVSWLPSFLSKPSTQLSVSMVNSKIFSISFSVRYSASRLVKPIGERTLSLTLTLKKLKCSRREIDNTLVPFALLRNRSFHPRLGLSDHWYGNGYLDGERKRFCKIWQYCNAGGLR